VLISSFGQCPECRATVKYQIDDRVPTLYAAPEVDRMVRRELAAHDKACAAAHERRRAQERTA
jgi:protein-disulfide isomerase